MPKLPSEMGGVVGDGVHEDVGEAGDDVEGRVEEGRPEEGHE